MCRKLLARLCIVREEIAEAIEEKRAEAWQSGRSLEEHEGITFLKKQPLPKASLIFLKELLNVKDKDKR